MYKQGQKLVCIDDNWTNKVVPNLPKKGDIVTFDKVSNQKDGYILLKEYYNLHFRASFFAPVQDKPDSVIKDLANKAIVPEKLDVIEIQEPQPHGA